MSKIRNYAIWVLSLLLAICQWLIVAGQKATNLLPRLIALLQKVTLVLPAAIGEVNNWVKDLQAMLAALKAVKPAAKWAVGAVLNLNIPSPPLPNAGTYMVKVGAVQWDVTKAQWEYTLNDSLSGALLVTWTDESIVTSWLVAPVPSPPTPTRVKP